MATSLRFLTWNTWGCIESNLDTEHKGTCATGIILGWFRWLTRVAAFWNYHSLLVQVGLQAHTSHVRTIGTGKRRTNPHRYFAAYSRTRTPYIMPTLDWEDDCYYWIAQDTSIGIWLIRTRTQIASSSASIVASWAWILHKRNIRRAVKPGSSQERTLCRRGWQAGREASFTHRCDGTSRATSTPQGKVENTMQ